MSWVMDIKLWRVSRSSPRSSWPLYHSLRSVHTLVAARHIRAYLRLLIWTGKSSLGSARILKFCTYTVYRSATNKGPWISYAVKRLCVSTGGPWTRAKECVAISVTSRRWMKLSSRSLLMVAAFGCLQTGNVKTCRTQDEQLWPFGELADLLHENHDAWNGRLIY